MEEPLDQEFPPHPPFPWLDRLARGLGRWSVRLTLCVVVFSFLAAAVLPNFLRARAQGRMSPCKSNLKNIATALEMWSTDHGEKFPDRLGQLTPNYLKTIPTCPSAGRATYEYTGHDDLYTVVCAGQNHGAASMLPNYPQFTAVQGLIER